MRALRLDLEHAAVGHGRASLLYVTLQKSVLPKRRRFTDLVFTEKYLLPAVFHLLEVSRWSWVKKAPMCSSVGFVLWRPVGDGAFDENEHASRRT